MAKPAPWSPLWLPARPATTDPPMLLRNCSGCGLKPDLHALEEEWRLTAVDLLLPTGHLRGCGNLGTTFAGMLLPCLLPVSKPSEAGKHDGCTSPASSVLPSLLAMPLEQYEEMLPAKACTAAARNCLNVILTRHPASYHASTVKNDAIVPDARALKIWNRYYGVWMRLLQRGVPGTILRSEDVVLSSCAERWARARRAKAGPVAHAADLLTDARHHYAARTWRLPSKLRPLLEPEVLAFYNYTVTWTD